MGCCQSQESEVLHDGLTVRVCTVDKLESPSELATIHQIRQRNEIMWYGYPTTDSIFQYEGHILAYSGFFKCPLWVCERLTKDQLRCKVVERSEGVERFEQTPNLHPAFATESSDYWFPGYDRGHMAAAGNHQYSPKAHAHTFFLSNICPQSHDLNKGLWNDLEQYARDMAWQNGPLNPLYILTGPLFLGPEPGYFRKEGDHQAGDEVLVIRRIGPAGVALPSHFFKVLRCGSRLEAFILPNRNGLKGPLQKFRVDVKEVDRKAGFRVFPRFIRRE